MDSLSNIKFKNLWDKNLEKRFWNKLNEHNGNIEHIYPFDFCSLKSEIRTNEKGVLHLCYILEERRKSGNEKIDEERNLKIEILKEIFFNIFGDERNEKYIGFYKFSKNENFRDVLRALFVLGNVIDDSELQNFMLDDETKIIYENFEKASNTSDELFEDNIKEIVAEFEKISLKVKTEIYKSHLFVKMSENFVEMFPVFGKRE